MQRKLYISNLDSSFSHHLAQFFREDHLQVDPALKLVGSARTPSKLPWIHATIDVPFRRFSSRDTLSWLAGQFSTATW